MIIESPEVKKGYDEWCASRNVSDLRVHRRDAKDFNRKHFDNGVIEGRSTVQARGIESQM